MIARNGSSIFDTGSNVLIPSRIATRLQPNGSSKSSLIEHRSRSERVSLSNFVTTTAAIAPSEFLISRIIR